MQLQESCEKNPAAFGGESIFKNQIGVEADVFEKEVQVLERKSHSSIVTDVSECFFAASKNNENINGDNSSVKSSNVQLKLRKSSQSNDLDKSQAISENTEPPSFNGLSI